MIGATLAREIEAILRGREFPVRVLYGPQRFAPEGPHMQLRLERDAASPETFGAAPGPRSDDSRPVAQRELSFVWTVHARSSAGGATLGEDERVLDDLVDALFVALREWGSAGKTAVSIGEARILTPEERGVEALANGAAYLLRISVAHGILPRDYRGDGRPTGTATAVGAGALEVSIDGTNYEDV